MKILIATNTFGTYHRQNVAVQSWMHLRKTFPDNVEIADFQFTDENSTNYDNLLTRFVLTKSSKDLVPYSAKKLPLIYEIIDCASSSEEFDYVVYVNSDVILLPKIIEYILNNKPDAIAGPRLDIEDIDSFDRVLQDDIKVVRNEIAGYDFFAFRTEWWNSHKTYFNHDFFIGKPLFDVDYAGLIVLLAKDYHIANDYPVMALHIHHGTASVTTECVEKTHNEKVHKSNILLEIANNVMFYNLQYNLCKRKPWGSFLKPSENEGIFQKQFFDSMNIHHANTIKYIE